MPVVLAPAALWTAFILACLVLAAVIVIVALLEKISFRVPGVGDVHIPGIRRIAGAIEDAWRDWLRPHLNILTGWLDNVATHLREFPREVSDFATVLARRLDHYVHTRSHQVISAFLRPVRTLATEAKTLAAAATAGLVDLRGDARAWVRAAEAAATAAITDLRGDARRWVREAEAAATAAIAAVHQLVVEGVLPRIGAIEDALPGIRIDLDDLRGLYNRVAEWFLPIAAVFSGAAALALLRHVNDCRARSDRLCSTDPAFLDELLGLAFIGMSISELQAFIRSTAPAVSALADEFIDRD